MVRSRRKEEVIKAISSGNLTMKETAEILSMDYNNLSRIVRGAVDEGILEQAPPQPGDHKSIKRFKLSNMEQERSIGALSPDRIIYNAFDFIKRNHPEYLNDQDNLDARFERAVKLIATFPFITDVPKRKAHVTMAKSHVYDVLREFEIAVEILRALVNVDLVNESSYPIVKSTEAKTFTRDISDRVSAVKAKSASGE